MNERNYPNNLLAQAKNLVSALNNIDHDFRIGALTNAALAADLEKGEVLRQRLKELEVQLVDLRNQRDALYGEIWKKVKRLRAAVKAIYGDDSSEYEMAGGTRLSERKPRSRKKVVETQS